jgi:hypothetical protein
MRGVALAVLVAIGCAFDSSGESVASSEGSDGPETSAGTTEDPTADGPAEVCNGVDDDGDLAIDEYSPQNTRCNDCSYQITPDGTQVQSYCTDALPWALALARCVTLGGNLVSIHSKADNDFVFGQTIGARAWIGFTDDGTEGAWYWTDFSSADFTAWTAAEPNNTGGIEHCAVMQAEGPTWNDTECAWEEPYVCRAPV